MKANNRFLFAISLVLALAFALSCSNDDNSPQPPKTGEVSSSSSYGGSSDSKVLCGNDSYDPSIYRCEMKELIGKCKGNDYYVAYERCIDGVVVSNNSNSSSSSSSVEPSSNSEDISSSSSMLSSSSICTATDNTSTQYCSNGTMKQYGFVTYAEQTYKTVEIGEQTWMAENLNYNASGSKCFNNCGTNCTVYGSLYYWATAMTVCPSGWHLPTDTDWNALVCYVDGTNGTCNSYSSPTAGRHLKAASGWAWGNGLDTYGFAALPGGSGIPKKVIEKVAKSEKISNEVRGVTLKNGSSRFDNQVQWARQYLVYGH